VVYAEKRLISLLEMILGMIEFIAGDEKLLTNPVKNAAEKRPAGVLELQASSTESSEITITPW
jgi:hypothetical protein